MNFDIFTSKWSSLHNNAATTGIVGGWLRISYLLAHAARKIRLTPNALTLLGVVAASFALLGKWWALILIPLSLAFDGVDGSLSIITDTHSPRGAIYDSIADRVVEGIWAVVAYQLGAPFWLVALFWSVASFQEYARARITSLGVSDLGVVTIMERPMRASALFIALVLEVLGISGVLVVISCALALQIFSALVVVRFANQLLQQPSQR